jgi:hypothetical protein
MREISMNLFRLLLIAMFTAVALSEASSRKNL